MDPVIIIGAGLGGLLLALLLETPPPSSPLTTSTTHTSETPPTTSKAAATAAAACNIPYIILERSTLRKIPVEGGGVIFLTPQIQPLLERLGVLEELRKISRPVSSLTVYENTAAAAASGSGSGTSSRLGAISPQGGGGGGKGGSASGSGSVLEQSDNQEPKESGVQDGALFSKTRFDYDTLAISRPELYNFLVDRIPEGKLLLGKQVQELVFQDIMTPSAHDGSAASAPTPVSEVSVPASVPSGIIRSSGSTGAEVEVEVQVQTEEVGAEKEGRAMTMMPIVGKGSAIPTATTAATTIVTPSTAEVVCTDGTRYGGIIVGADGAYSTVRLSLYRHLRERGLLAAAAEESTTDVGHGPMRSLSRVLVGMTRELDPGRFTLLKNEFSDVRVLISHNGVSPFMFWCVPMTGNKLCWMLDEQLAQEQICPEIEDFTQDQQAIRELCESVRSTPSPCSNDSGDTIITLGEIILDSTPSGTQMLLPREEGYVSTWTHGNVTLMGDACHKALPYTGQPIAQAGQDAFKLANVLWQSSMYHRSMYAGSRLDLDLEEDASLACGLSLSSSPTTAGGNFSFASISSSSRETEQTRLGCCWEGYEVERRTEAEHAVRQAGRFVRLLMMMGKQGRTAQIESESAGSGNTGSGEGLEVRDLDSSFEEGRERIEKELQALLGELQPQRLQH